MPITAFYSADVKLLEVAGGPLAHDALLERLRQLYGADGSELGRVSGVLPRRQLDELIKRLAPASQPGEQGV